MRWCAKCRRYHWGEEKCSPEWLVWCEDFDEDIHNVIPTRGSDEQHAAERWAEEDDAGGDYTIIGGSEVTVHVARKDEYDELMDRLEDPDAIGREPPAGLKVKTFIVSGETVPSYHAKEVEHESKT